MDHVSELSRRLDQAWPPDRYRLRRLLRSVEQAARAGKPHDRNLVKLTEELEQSIALRARRRLNVPAVTYDEELPVSARREELAAAIASHQVVVICGETGSGKSTQLPKICLELGRGIDGLIGHTQPRRIAARSVASRIASELRSRVGEHVGFKVRFNDVTSPQTYIKLMTDGILLAETQNDRFLDQYDTIIVDEAHERSLNIDFLLGYLKQLLPKRKNLKVLVTSATIDAERFARYYAEAIGEVPVIQVAGRTYPVDIRYRPAEEDDLEPDWKRSVLAAVRELRDEGDRGHILVFLPTERDIHELAKALRGQVDDRTEVLPLYARLSGGEQDQVFRPTSRRRIVLATNVAESSLTVPGIRYVIDTGTARISRYSARTRTQRLPIEPIAQASADQRAGRCGRIGPGICIRLYSEADYEGRERYTPPEIQRTNLASVILQTLALQLGAIEEFPFLDPPKSVAISDGHKTLFELGAIDENRRLTQIGRRLSQIPVDPRIGRMLLAADANGSLAEVLIIASALEAQDPRERPLEKQQAADEAHARFLDPESDFLSYLKLWDYYHGLKGELSRSKLEKACRQNFLSYNRLREWSDLQLQLRDVVSQAGMKPTARRNDYAAIHQAVLAGLLSGIGLRTDENDYLTAGSTKAWLWPGSGLREKKPKWVVAAEMVETTRRYLRTAARISPDWIEPLADHLVKRTYSEPHWSRERGTVQAYERVTLFAIPIVLRRSVNYGLIDPTKARELFIQGALVKGQFDGRAEFLEHNRRVVQEAEALQAKLRRGDLLLGEEARYAFYDERIPPEVFDARSLQAWWRNARRSNPQLLHMRPEDVARSAEEAAGERFPDAVQLDGIELPLEYRFELASPADGVTVTVPKAALARLDDARLGWLVPGLLEQKITGLLKGLPKDLRRLLVPIPDTARRLRQEIQPGQGSLTWQVAKAVERLFGVRLPGGALREENLPDYLRMNIRVVDERGDELAVGRDLTALRRQIGAEDAAAIAAVDETPWHREGITAWDFGELPQMVELEYPGGVVVAAYPALFDRGQAAALVLVESPERAERETLAGVRRLALLALRQKLLAQAEWLPDAQKILLWGNTLGGPPLREQLAQLLLERAMPLDEGPPRTKEAFDASLKAAKNRLSIAVQEVAEVLAPLMAGYHEARLALENARAPHWASVAADVQSQLEWLVRPGFLTSTPWEWLRHYPRYFRAIVLRFEKLRSGGMARDRAAYAELRPRWEAYLEMARQEEQEGIHREALEQYRWMLEEFRVSLFAQQLGTAVPVSAKRLDKQWAAVGEAVIG